MDDLDLQARQTAQDTELTQRQAKVLAAIRAGQDWRDMKSSLSLTKREIDRAKQDLMDLSNEVDDRIEKLERTRALLQDAGML